MEVTFKKKSKRSKAGRKRSVKSFDATTAISDEDARECDEIDEIQRSIEELREDQRLRDQVLREELVTPKPETATNTQKKAKMSTDISQYGLHDSKKDGSASQKLLTLLDGQFTGQSTTTDKDQHEELMNKFIEERLQRKRKADTSYDVGGADNAVVALKTAEDKLFELPEHLKPHLPSTKTYDDAAEGGMLMGNAGIAEVELPASYTKETETLVKRALELKKSDSLAKLNPIGGLASSVVPGNFSTDFNRHRTDYVAGIKHLNRGKDNRAEDERRRGF